MTKKTPYWTETRLAEALAEAEAAEAAFQACSCDYDDDRECAHERAMCAAWTYYHGALAEAEEGL